MTAKQPQHAPVRLLIAENSENAAQQCDSLLRDAGIATRTELIELHMAAGHLAKADMLLANAGIPELAQFLPKIKAQAPHLPIILINSSGEDVSLIDGLKLGAADVIPRAETERLVLVVKRELEHVCQNVRLKDVRKALEEAEQRCRLLLESSKAAIAYVHEGMHIYANAGYLKLFGFSDADELLGLPLIDLLDQTSAAALKQALKQFRQKEQELTIDFKGQSTRGDEVSGNMTLAAAEYEGEHCLQVTVRTGALQAQQSAAAATAAPDDGIPTLEPERANGAAGTAPAPPPAAGHVGHDLAGFLHEATELFSASSKGFRCIFVAEVDDHTRLQHDHGLAGAKQIAHEVAARLSEAVGDRPLAQLSSHQFAIAMSGANRDAVTSEVDGFRAEVEGLLLEINEKTVRPTLTFGGAELVPDEDLGLHQAVDTCMNAAFATVQAALEELDGNCVELPSASLAATLDGNDEAGKVLALINEAIENQRFLLLFQPIISLRGDSDEHYEVFLRMLDRDSNQMAPGQFLRTAIDNGVAGKIDRWVILQSIKMLSGHRSKGHNTRLTINLTCNSVIDPDFLQWLSVAIKAARLPSDAVIFQVTERDAATYVRQTREFVEGLKGMHCRASLSRFGLNDDPFQLLEHIPIEFVKLDGSHIERLEKDPDLREELTGMIRKLQSAGKLTIVPMVESANVLSALWQAGANYIQGHYLQEPSTEMDYDFSNDD